MKEFVKKLNYHVEVNFNLWNKLLVKILMIIQ